MATPLLRRLFSSGRRYQYIPLAPSWDPRELTAARPAPISDADMARLERLSNLRLPREEGARARAHVAAVLSTAAQLAVVSCENSEPLLTARLRALPEAALEAAAEARWARLRADEVTEGGDAAGIVAHAAVREGLFFSAPRFVDGAEGAFVSAEGGGGHGGAAGEVCSLCEKEEPLDSCSACGATFCDDHDTENLVYPINHKEGCNGYFPDDCDCLDARGELPPLCLACERAPGGGDTNEQS